MDIWPLLAITDGPTPNAAVRCDMASPSMRLENLPDFDFGSPDISGTGVGAEAGPRTHALPMLIRGSDDVVSQALASVASAVGRRGAWLMYQRSVDTKPYWWRIIGPVAGSINRRHVKAEARASAWHWTVRLVTDGYAVEQERNLFTGTLKHDLSGISVALPAPEGDASAPVSITLTPSTGWSGAAMVAMAHVDAGSPLTVAPAWGWKDWVRDSGGGFGNPVVSRSSNNAISGTVVELSYGTSGSVFTTPAKVPPGRYRLMVRTQSRAGSRLQVRAGLRYGSTTSLWTPWRAVNVGGADVVSWIDFGTLSLPGGVPLSSLDGDDSARAPQIELQQRVQYGTSEPTAGAGYDAAMLVPERLARGAGASIMSLRFQGAGPQPGIPLRIDSEQRRTTLLDVGGFAWNAPQPLISGAFPAVMPDQRNILTILPNLDGLQDVMHSATVDVTVRYRPRRLHPA